MAFKFVVFAAFVVVARAGHLGLGAIAPGIAYGAHGAVSTYSNVQHHAAPYAHAAPIVHAAPYAHAAPIVHAEPSAPAHYDFGYAVSDPHTGDHKQQQESRRGDVVHGSYSLLESDGTKRVVEYSADPHNGFNAVVHKEPAAHAIHAAPVVAAAPAYGHGYDAPAYAAHGYAAPAYAHGYAAPYAHQAPVLSHGW